MLKFTEEELNFFKISSVYFVIVLLTTFVITINVYVEIIPTSLYFPLSLMLAYIYNIKYEYYISTNNKTNLNYPTSIDIAWDIVILLEYYLTFILTYSVFYTVILILS